MNNRYPKIGYNPYEPFLEIYSSQKEIHPISNRPEDKRSFIPSIDERRMVSRMVHAIKMGWRKRVEDDDEDKELDETEEVVLPKVINFLCFGIQSSSYTLLLMWTSL